MVPSKLKTASYFLAGLVVGVTVVGAFSFVYWNYIFPESKIATPVEAIYPEDVEEDKPESQSLTSSRPNAEVSELDFQELLKKSQFDRSRVLHDHTRHADLDSVLRFLERSKTIVSIDLRREVQEVAIRRLARLDPIAALQQVKESSRYFRSPLMIAVFDEWSGEELKVALAHASSLSEEDKRNALKGILLSRLNLSDSLRLDLVRQLGHEQVLIDSQALVLAGEPVEDPASAWTEFLGDHGRDVASLNEAQLLFLRHIVDSWIELGVGRDVANVVSSALKKGDNESVVQLLLETLARHDLSVALHATSSIEDSERRTQMQQAIVAEWIEMDPLAVLDGMELIPFELHGWSKQQALVALSTTSPSDAASRLGIISSSEARGEVARSIASNWAKLDPEAAREWAVSESDVQDLRWGLMYGIVWEVSQVDPDKALEWALDEPVNEQLRGRGLEQTVIRSVALQGKYETAISMVDQARDIENQQWSFIQIGNALAQRGRIEESLRLFGEIPDRFQLLYGEQVSANWVWNEPDTALETLESLPSQDLKEAVARNLFYLNQMRHMFSNEQLRELKKYLPQRYQEQIE